MLTAVVSIFLVTLLASFNTTEAKIYDGTGQELDELDESDIYWCLEKNETDCLVNRELMAKYCKQHCEEVFIAADEFISKYNKTYENEGEAKKRMAIFSINYVKIREHNKLFESGKSSFKMGVKEHSDMTYEEFIDNFTGFKLPSLVQRYAYPRFASFGVYVPINLGKEPKSLDYRDMGAFNPIRSQSPCNTCWAYAAVASIESNIFLKTGKLLQLSEQSLVDCSIIARGCKAIGHTPMTIRQTIRDGIAYRDDYPYTRQDGPCRDVPRIYPVAGQKRIQPIESHIMNALVHVGPIVVSMHASAMLYWSDGKDVFEGSSRSTNHGVLLIGYGTDNVTGMDYWLIRNSWGEGTGDNGYHKITRNVKYDCGILKVAHATIIKETPTCEDKPNNCAWFESCCKKEAINLVWPKTCDTCPDAW